MEPVSLDDTVPAATGGDAARSAPPLSNTLTSEAYDPTREREGVRSQIALRLVSLLAVIIVAPFVMILLGVGCDALGPGSDICRRIPVITLKEVMDTLLTPMVGLVGAVTGFYFGDSKARSG